MKATNLQSTILTAFLLSFLPASQVRPQLSASQTVTVQVVELNTVMVSHLSRDSAEPARWADYRMARLTWTSNGDARKITVSSPNLPMDGDLQVQTGQWDGSRTVNESSVNLANSVTYDLLRHSSPAAGECKVRYILARDMRERADWILVVYTVTSG